MSLRHLLTKPFLINIDQRWQFKQSLKKKYKNTDTTLVGKYNKYLKLTFLSTQSATKAMTV